MIESSINKSMIIASEPDEIEKVNETSFPAAIEAIGNAILEKAPNKTTNLSSKNVKGLITIDVFNDYMKKNFGHEITPLTELSQRKVERSFASGGWGTARFIEAIKGIQVAFEQTELPHKLSGLLRR